jgi:hypothetical protein
LAACSRSFAASALAAAARSESMRFVAAFAWRMKSVMVMVSWSMGASRLTGLRFVCIIEPP